MKRLLIIFLIGSAQAGPVDNMVAQCEAVMKLNVCRVQLDRKSYVNPTVLIAGVGRVSTESYVKIRNSGDHMCKVVREVCTTAFDGDDCRAARALWRQ
jgi:hypothetical protein